MAKMSEMSLFQTIVLIGFLALAIISVILFTIGPGSENELPEVELTVWGIISERDFKNWVSDSELRDETNLIIDYKQYERDQLKNTLIEAMAVDRGPDLLFLVDKDLALYRDWLFTVPYDWITQREFKDTFVDHSFLLLNDKGVFGLPIVLDPLVTYWNRSLISNAGLTSPPSTWDDLEEFPRSLTVTDGEQILKSAVPLGGYDNIEHAEHILAGMLFQLGTKLVYKDDDNYLSDLGRRKESNSLSLYDVLGFYTSFTDRTSTVYSWHRTLPNSLDFFTQGNSALYFGLASDRERIIDRNPNLNFDTSPFLIHSKDALNLGTGELYLLAMPINQDQYRAQASWRAMRFLTAPGPVGLFEEMVKLPPARRDLLNNSPTDPYMDTFYQAAVRSVGWLNPDPVEVNRILREMVRSVTTGSRTLRDAADWAGSQMNILVREKLN